MGGLIANVCPIDAGADGECAFTTVKISVALQGVRGSTGARHMAALYKHLKSIYLI